MSRQYSIAEARDRLPALVHDAERGGSVTLTRRGRPVAVLISAPQYERLIGKRPDLWSALQEFRRKHELGDLDVDEIFANVRERSPGRESKW